MSTVLELAKEYFTIIAVAKELFPDWSPPKRGTSCRCPYREDKNPSFSIFAGGRADQLLAVAAHVDGVTFKNFVRSNGERCKDLNDLCDLSAETFEAHRSLIEGIMNF